MRVAGGVVQSAAKDAADVAALTAPGDPLGVVARDYLGLLVAGDAGAVGSEPGPLGVCVYVSDDWGVCESLRSTT